jgi:hypothetical protein
MNTDENMHNKRAKMPSFFVYIFMKKVELGCMQNRILMCVK